MELIFFCILLVFSVITGVVLGLIEGAKHPDKHNKPRYTSGKSIVDLYMGR